MADYLKWRGEGLIELKSTRSQAVELAKQIRDERGLEARLGGGHYAIPSQQNRAESSGTFVAQRVIVFAGTLGSYGQATQDIRDLKGMLRGMRTNGSGPEITISQAYDENGNAVYNKPRTRHR